MRSRAWIPPLLGVAFVGVVGCDGCGKKEDVAPPPVVAEPPVAAPDGLLVEATLATPDATWQRVQRGIGGTAGILPSTLGGVVCAMAGIDPTLGPELDGSSPAFVVVAGDPAAPSWAIAARLADARRVRGALVEGETARFDAKPLPGAGFDVLVPKRPRGPGPVAALSKAGFFVVAKGEGDLATLGAYATRTLPTRPLRKEQVAIDVPGTALAGAVRSAAERSWGAFEQGLLQQDEAMRTQHGGRAPDFGDPHAIVASMDAWVQSKLAVLGDWRSVHVAFDAGDGDVRAVVTAAPASANGPASAALASLRPGDAAPLRALPRDTAIALFARDDAAVRAKDAEGIATAIDGALGPRLGPTDEKKVRAALADWAQARGDWQLLAAPWGPSGRGLLLDAATTDADRSQRAVKDGLDVVARSPAVRGPLASWLGVKQATPGTAPIPGGGRASTMSFEVPNPTTGSGAKGSPASATSFGVAWTATSYGGGEVRVALSDAPLPLLAPTPAGATLGDDPALRAVLDPLGPVAGMLVAQPSRAPGCANDPGTVVVAWSRRPAEGDGQPEGMWAEIVASDAAARCLAPKPF